MSSGGLRLSGSSRPGGIWLPQDHGLLAWSYDPVIAAASSIMSTAGRVECVRLKMASAAPITNIHLQCATAGATLTSGQCFAAVFQSGALLGVTADQATNWQSTGEKKMALAGGPFPATLADVIVAFYANGTTLPTWARQAGTGPVNANLAAANARYGFDSVNTGRTTSMPSTLGTLAALGLAWWVGVS